MEKTIVFDGGNSSNNLLASILPALQNRGVDTGYLMGMLGNNNGGLFGGRGFEDIIALIIVAAIFGNGNGFGFGGNNNNNSTEREMLMSAIQRNGVDLNALASTLNCSVGQLQNGINSVATQICNLSAQNGQSAMQIINSIQAGNATLASQLAQCCCDQKLAICQQTNTLQSAINGVSVGQERGFANFGFETQRQTCDITKAIADSTAQVLAGQRAAELRELNRDLAAKDAKIAEQAVVINNGQQSALFGQMIANATAPLGSALNALQQEVAGVKCKLPETYSVPYQPFTAIPNCVAYQYGLYGGAPFAAGTGFFG